MTWKQRTRDLIGGIAVASASVLLLASCGASPSTTADQPSQPAPSASASASAGGNAAELDYPMFYDEAMLDQWASARDEFTSALDGFAADCTAQETNESEDCHTALADLLRQTNGLKQLWLTFDNSDWDSGTYSGLTALKPTRDATLVASASGSDWSGSCAATGGDEECVAEAEVFLGDLDLLNAAFAAWQG